MVVQTASCSYGRRTATATGDPIRVSVCHRFACQRRTGRAFGAHARFSRTDVEIQGDATSYVRTGDCGRRATFSRPEVSVYENRKHPWMDLSICAEHFG